MYFCFVKIIYWEDTSGVTSRYGELLKKAKSSARTWKNLEREREIEAEKSMFDKILQKVNLENWAMNATVHFNKWVDMGKTDFMEIRNSYYCLVEQFKCNKCNTYLHVIPLKGASESLKCDCGSRNYNLKSKS
jgi:hypothetical protein